MKLFNILILSILTIALQAQTITNKQCISGNCQDGFGTLKYKKNNKSYRYKGEFQGGMFNGSGVIYYDDPWGDNGDIPQEIGMYKDNERRGGFRSYFLSYDKTLEMKQSFRSDGEYLQKSDKTVASKYKVTRISKSGKVVSERTKYFVHYSPNGKKIILDKPFATAFGNCISGDCENGEGKLQLEGIGVYEGKFFNGRANGTRQKLTLTTGEMMFVTVGQGILYEEPITIKLPAGVSRVEMAKRRVWKLRPYSCLEGDCYNGKGTALYGHADRAQETKIPKHIEETQGYFVGEFKNNIRQNGTLYTFNGRVFKGNFSEGLNGQYAATINGKSETWHFKYGKRVTADGQPYEEYLAQQEANRREATKVKFLKKPIATNTNVTIPESAKVLHLENFREKKIRSFYFPAFLDEREVYIQIIDMNEWIQQEVELTHGGTTQKYVMKDGKISVKFRYDPTSSNTTMGFGSQRNSKYKVIVCSTQKSAPVAKNDNKNDNKKDNSPKVLTPSQHKGIAEDIVKKLIPQLQSKYGYSHIKTEYILARDLSKTQTFKMHGGNEYGIIAISSDSKITPKLTWKYKKKGMKSSAQKTKSKSSQREKFVIMA